MPLDVENEGIMLLSLTDTRVSLQRSSEKVNEL